MPETRVPCAACGQDYLTLYRNVLDGEQFFLCPECDSVWFPGEDTAQPMQHDLYDLFPGHQFLPGEVAWDFIEPVSD